MMEHSAFLDLIEKARTGLENDIINDLLVKHTQGDDMKDTIGAMLKAFNARGVSSRTVLDVLLEICPNKNKQEGDI